MLSAQINLFLFHIFDPMGNFYLYNKHKNSHFHFIQPISKQYLYTSFKSCFNMSHLKVNPFLFPFINVQFILNIICLYYIFNFMKNRKYITLEKNTCCFMSTIIQLIHHFVLLDNPKSHFEG